MQQLCTHVDPSGSDGGSHSEATWVSFKRGCAHAQLKLCIAARISSQRCNCVKKCVCRPSKAFKIV